MNNAQQKYLRDRLQTLTRHKKDQLTKQYPDKLLEVSDKIKALREGRFTVLDDDQIEKNRRSYYISLENFLKFDGEESNWEIRKEKETKIQAEADAILDQLMLGEEDGLLEALRAFEQKEF